jgi:IS30 family transposase
MQLAMSGFIGLLPPTNVPVARSIRICDTTVSAIKNATKATTGAGGLRNRVSITERPSEAETRERLGDWEGDTVHGVDGNLVTLVDRKSGYLSAYPVKRRTRRQVMRAINLLFQGHAVHTLTLDNGREFAGHERIALKSHCQVYFADPYSSWQRGTNENTNGLLRQYFPKGSDFSKLTVEAVNRTVAQINLRPRKRLGWKTPYEVYSGVSVALMC